MPGLNDAAINGFGQMMVTDHNMAPSELPSMAQNMSVSIPQGPDSGHVALKSQLSAMSGYSFDSLYIHSQVKDHQKQWRCLKMKQPTGATSG